MSGVLSLAGGSDSPSEAQDLMPEITEQREDKMLSRPVGHYKLSEIETDIQLNPLPHRASASASMSALTLASMLENGYYAVV